MRSRFFHGAFFVAFLVLATSCSSGGSPESVDARINTVDAPPGQCAFCAEDEDCCGGFCVDTQSNLIHCGGCNITCAAPAADTCSFGQCTCAFGPACEGGQACCENIGCRDLQNDSNNCGGCGITCGPNEACQGGQCVCAADGAQCAGGETCCVDGCSDLQTDPNNCSACGMVCEGGNPACDGGACGCADACPDTPVPGCCANGCYDLCNDASNCGECGTVCATGGCALGACSDDIFDFPLVECIGFP